MSVTVTQNASSESVFLEEEQMRRIKGKLKRNLIIGLLVCLNLLALPQFAEADSFTVLPSGMIVGDNQGIKVKSDGQYLVDIRDVQPGKKWSTKITIFNMEEDIPYHLTMNVKQPVLVEGSLDLSKAIQMTLTYEGEKVYQGPLSGTSPELNLQNELTPLDLGVFKGGDTRMLEAFFELDGKKYTNRDFFKKNVVENSWHFKAVKTALPDTNNPKKTQDDFTNLFRLPQTGEEWRDVIIFSCIGLFFLLVALLLIKRQIVEKNKEN